LPANHRFSGIISQSSDRPDILSKSEDDRSLRQPLELAMPATLRIEVADADGTQVVTFRDRLLFDDRTVREVSDQLGAALPNDGKPIRIVLDFTGVDLISSSLLGKLILLQRRVDGSGGKLRLCELSPTVQSVFKTSNLDRLFGIVRDRRAALAEM
jgi:anti-sigma B factor antagonist